MQFSFGLNCPYTCPGFRGSWTCNISFYRYKEAKKWGLSKSFSSSISRNTYEFSSPNGKCLSVDAEKSWMSLIYWNLHDIFTAINYGYCVKQRFDMNLLQSHVIFKFFVLFMQRAQDLANVTSYREWVLFGYLVCPDELLRVTSIDIALVIWCNYYFFGSYCDLKECLKLPIQWQKQECEEGIWAS